MQSDVMSCHVVYVLYMYECYSVHLQLGTGQGKAQEAGKTSW